MENQQKRFRAFENSVDAQVLVPGVNAEFNDFIRTLTVVPVEKLGMHVTMDPFKTVEMLLHQYDGTPGKKCLCRILKTFIHNRTLKIVKIQI